MKSFWKNGQCMGVGILFMERKGKESGLFVFLPVFLIKPKTSIKEHSNKW
jgi:hypothetical protein